jgi:hypothetical protein
LGRAGKKIVDPAGRSRWINFCLNGIRTVFSSGAKGERLLLAAQWLFDGYGEHDELLKFVQATVTLEVLLGDKKHSDEVGIGALIRNRCAYLIGESQSEREEILRDFSDIYEVRSRIVHRGLRRLSPDDRTLLTKLRTMCMRVIFKDVLLLGKETK